MHELSIAQNILEIVTQHVPGEQAAAVRAVRIRLGALSGVVRDSLEFSFEAIVAGTPWEAARLEVQHQAARGACAVCSREFPIEEAFFVCPSCGNREIRVISGTELDLVEIVLEDEPAEVS